MHKIADAIEARLEEYVHVYMCIVVLNSSTILTPLPSLLLSLSPSLSLLHLMSNSVYIVKAERDRYRQSMKTKYDEEQALRQFLRDYMLQEKQADIERKRDIVHYNPPKYVPVYIPFS
eukprot:TRINITY_DN3597_c0_g2_i3.p2 TRINITY_DN3597_c0_g2~~TRINITY_DN3597_c0_g2_i3.p2  ORF type:complete len:118 (+),score=29.57 TRINITY_DN3597_c0_g2_i3:501-854(+)